MKKDDYIAFRNRDTHYFITGLCTNPNDIFELSIIHNDVELFEIMYIKYRYCVDLYKIMDYAIIKNRKHIAIFLHNRGITFSEDSVIKSALYGNKEMLEWCLDISTVMTNINKGRFADAIFKGGLDTTIKSSNLGILIKKVLG